MLVNYCVEPILYISLPKNILNTTLKKMGSLDKTIVFNVLIMVVIMVCDSVVLLL
jgi:hypothetical protein